MKKNNKIKVFTIVIIVMITIFTIQVLAKPNDIINIAPQVTLNTTPMTNKRISIGIVTDYEGPKLMALQNKANQTRAALLSKGINADINYVTSNMNNYTTIKKSMGVQNLPVKKPIYVRYFRIKYIEDCYVSTYYDHNGEEHQTAKFNVPCEEDLEYETYTPTHGEQPPNFRFSNYYRFNCLYSDQLSEHDGSDGSHSYSYSDKYEMYDPDNMGDSRQFWTIYRQKGFTPGSNGGSESQLNVKYHLTGTSLDTSWNYELRDANEPKEIFSLDTQGALQNYGYSVNNNSNYDKKYLFLISDSSADNSMGSDWGEYYPFSDIAWLSYLKDYLKMYFSNLNIYSVLNKNVLSKEVTVYRGRRNTPYTATLGNDLLGSCAGDKIYDVGQYSKAFDDLVQDICDESGVGNPQYVIADEQTVSYIKGYTDYENDPIGAEKWKYVQDPNYFENSNGVADFNGKELNAPVTKFDKVGKYTITYQAQDNPLNSNNFLNYRKWSNAATAVIYVHRRPIANFYMSKDDSKYIGGFERPVLSLASDASYDIDHASEPGKGIVERRFRWKRSGYISGYGDSTSPSGWINGCPYNYYMHIDETITIEERVKDKEGAWSYPCIKTVSYDNYIWPENTKPIASFSLQNNPMPEKSSNIITDGSFDPDGDPIVERHFWLLDNNSNTLKDYGNSIPSPDAFKNLRIGSYKLKETVRDDPSQRDSWLPSLWSDPYILDFSVIKAEDPLKLINFRISSMINPPIKYTFPITLPDMPADCKAGYKDTFEINVQGKADTVTASITDNSNNSYGTVNLTKERDIDDSNSIWTFNFVVPLSTPKGTIIRFNIMGKNGETQYNYNEHENWDGSTLKVIGNALEDTKVYRRY